MKNLMSLLRLPLTFDMAAGGGVLGLISFVEALKAQALTETTKSAAPADPDAETSPKETSSELTCYRMFGLS
jgi:hypothetical protein